MDLLEALATHVLIADGAMGTLLRARGVDAAVCLEELCASQPELVTQVHRDYLAAGARLIRTHSFGANAARLAQWGLQRHVGEFNWLAARIARDAAKDTGALVAASVGPTGQGSGARALFEEQLGALLDGGAQCVIFETFTDVEELRVALEVKQSLHHCAAIASLARVEPAVGTAVPSRPRTAEDSGPYLASAWRTLREAGADLVGVNCLGTPAETLAALADLPLENVVAFPSAGLPDAHGSYALKPAAFADGACELVARGVRLVGGCCGTTPAHIAAFAARLTPAK